jgi:single-strand DNA-binding protein
MNHVTIIGNLGQDPEIRYTQTGTCVVNFNIAVNEYFKDKDGNKQQKVNWFRVSTFQRLAEIVGEYCKKGSKVGVTGQLQQRTWADKDGANHSVVEIRAREIELLSTKAGNGAEAGAIGEMNNVQNEHFDPADDIPF